MAPRLVIMAALLAATPSCVRMGYRADRDAGGDAAADAEAGGPPGALVLGQSTFTANENLAHGFYFPWDATSDGTRLFVADSNNNRVLLWSSLADATAGKPPDVVLGQPSIRTGSYNYGGLGRSSLNNPRGIAFDGTRLCVADTLNDRVLIWSTLPTADNAAADVILGGAGNVVSATSLHQPHDVALAGGRLLVADTDNNRVLVWNSVPTADGAAADVVLGQPDMTSAWDNAGGRSASSLNGPRAVASDGMRLLVADTFNRRVLIWDSLPQSDGAPADRVLGQPDFHSASGATVDARSLGRPGGVALWGKRLAVSDTERNRVLVWSSVPTASFAAADAVLGQPDMSSEEPNSGGRSAGSLSTPRGLAAAGEDLLVTDYDNNRLVLQDGAGAGASATVVGQPTADTGCPKGSHVTAGTFSAADALWLDGGQLLVADLYAHRILRWSPLPTASGAPAHAIVGQPSPGHCNRAPVPGGSNLRYPFGVSSDGTRLFVGDAANHRVLIWNDLAVAESAPADLVLGQPDMTSRLENNGGVSVGLSWPSRSFSDGTRLVLADPSNNRVLIWSSLPTKSGAAADLVLGQPDLTSNKGNNGGVSARSLSYPNDVALDQGRLFVADTSNSRVLIWNSFPTASFAPADVVLGQPDMASSGNNTGGVSARSLRVPRGLDARGTRLAVADTSNHRVLLWDPAPTVSGAPADRVVGQPDMATARPNSGGMSAASLYYPGDVAWDGSRLLVMDSANDRLLILPSP